ncbi:MAG TPA: DNA replication/repair protein RecF [Candidatus Limiplasma sp.]|nr:DNA replication/repair protein RecF [Candidatus Limiplasma sp.]
MKFSSLQLKNFRNYASLDLKPSEGITVLYGANGSGKTNLLESMHLLSVGRSHRTSTDREMIAQGEDVAFIRAQTQRLDGKHELEVRLYPLQRPQKRVLIHGKPAERIADMMGHATTVMFAPEDLRIVRDGPAARRRFIDMQLSQIRPSYLKALRRYLSTLESRNALLKSQKAKPTDDFDRQLDAWDEQLAGAAVYVVEPRRWFLEELSARAAQQYQAIAEDRDEVFTLRYTGPLATTPTPYRDMLAALKRSRSEDVRRLFTTFGPHRDDLSLLLSGKDLRAFGSQGQVRTAVLSMKLGEIQLIENEMGELPTLLLDDVFSELDHQRRNALLQSTKGVQTFITCTDKSDAAGAQADAFYRVATDDNGKASLTLTK